MEEPKGKEVDDFVLTNEADYFLWKTFELVSGLAFVLSIPLGGAALLHDVLGYLKVGEWDTFTVQEVFASLVPEGSTAWILYPDSWIGIWNILDWMPAWLAALIVMVVAQLGRMIGEIKADENR